MLVSRRLLALLWTLPHTNNHQLQPLPPLLHDARLMHVGYRYMLGTCSVLVLLPECEWQRS